MRWILLLALSALAACATPREACLRQATAELATLDRLIAETEADLARGYSVEQRVEARTGFTFCVGNRRYGHGTNVGFTYCPQTQTRVRTERVPIDPAASRRTLANLKARRADEARRAQAAIAACPISG